MVRPQALRPLPLTDGGHESHDSSDPRPVAASEERALVPLAPAAPSSTTLCLAPASWEAKAAAKKTSNARSATFSGREKKAQTAYEIFRTEECHRRPGADPIGPNFNSDTKAKFDTLSAAQRRYYESMATISKGETRICRELAKRQEPVECLAIQEDQDGTARGREAPENSAIVPRMPHSTVLVPYPPAAFGTDGLPEKARPPVTIPRAEVLAPPMTAADFESAWSRIRKGTSRRTTAQTQVVATPDKRVQGSKKQLAVTAKEMVNDFDATHSQKGGAGPPRSFKVGLAVLDFRLLKFFLPQPECF